MFTGVIDGVSGSLMPPADGFTRGDQIALVGGEDGPTAVVPLVVSAPGIWRKDLDANAKQLAGQLRGETAQPAA